jgi:cyclopropane-fatty-acyl-phospholipid synthase
MLAKLLRSIIRVGDLTVLYEGCKYRLGDGSGTPVTVRIRGHWVALRLAWDPDYFVGQAYMDGDLVPEVGDIADFLEICGRNLVNLRYPGSSFLNGVRRILRRLSQYNPPVIARRNVAHHYDLPPSFYRLFLDADLQYSCAYFPRPDATLEEAQAAKKALLASKLLLRPGATVLDIGCGFGGLGLFLARENSATVRGITLSTEQLDVATWRAREAAAGDKVTFAHADYRYERGTFDRIVSVGMFEHVGVPHYAAFFQKIGDLLADEGIAVVHSIGRLDGPGATNRWTKKYIFPGGYTPALSEVIPVIERSGLILTDIEILRLHYAETLKAWRERFLANRDEALKYGGERFCRMWEFYLAGSEMSFRYGGLMVFQLQLAKRIDTVPLTRDYLGLGGTRAGEQGDNAAGSEDERYSAEQLEIDQAAAE